MNILTRKKAAKAVAARWKEQYKGYWKSTLPTSCDHSKPIYEKLVALGKEPDPDAADKIIGNNGWTETRCHECGKPADAVVYVGEHTGEECDSEAAICLKCAERAVRLLKKATP